MNPRIFRVYEKLQQKRQVCSGTLEHEARCAPIEFEDKDGAGRGGGRFDIRVATFNIAGEVKAVERARQLGRMCPNLEGSD